MNTAFTITPVENGIMRYQDTGKFTPEDLQVMESFMLDYRGKLLIDSPVLLSKLFRSYQKCAHQDADYSHLRRPD